MPRPVQVYDFTAFSRRTPAAQPPGDRLDAQFRAHADAIAELQQTIAALRAELTQLSAAPREPTLSNPSLYYGAGGPYAGDDKGATATSADYAQVCIDWAEHMPDTIPPNTLAINAISGAHWSSRWWASRAASIVSAIGAVGAIPGTQGVFCEALVVAGGMIPNLSKTPAGPVLLVMNGVAFLPVGAQPPFAVAGKAITWLSPIYALFNGTEVAVWYPYAP